MSCTSASALATALGLGFVYLYSFPYIEQTHNANELPRIYLVQAMVERGALNIDDGVRRYGNVVDTATHGGHLYSNKAPGLSFVGVPVYMAQRTLHRLTGRPPPTLREQTFALRLFCVTLPALAFLWIFWRLTGFYTTDPMARRAALAGYALGTLALPFSLLYISHQPSAALIGTAFFLLAGPPTALRLVGVGLCIGGSVLLDYQSAFFALPLGGYALFRVRPWWRLALPVLGMVPPAVALGAYHKACFGSPLRVGYTFATNPQMHSWHHQGILGLTYPTASNVYQGFFSPDNGLFALSPWLLLGFVGLYRLWRRGERRAEVAVLGAMSATGIWFLSSLVFGRGGWQMGPRYIAIAIPFLALAAGAALEAAGRRPALGAAAGALVVAGTLIYTCSGLTFPLWPDKLRNPVVELAWPLVRDGYSPYSLGRLVGLPAAVAMIPAFAVALALVLAPVSGRLAAGRSLARAGAAVGGCALVALFWLAPRTPGPDSSGVARWIQSIWEPPRAPLRSDERAKGTAPPLRGVAR
jgi:hypothetical protein